MNDDSFTFNKIQNYVYQKTRIASTHKEVVFNCKPSQAGEYQSSLKITHEENKFFNDIKSSMAQRWRFLPSI